MNPNARTIAGIILIMIGTAVIGAAYGTNANTFTLVAGVGSLIVAAGIAVGLDTLKQ